MATMGGTRRADIPVPRKRGRMTILDKIIVELARPLPECPWGPECARFGEEERVQALRAARYLQELVQLEEVTPDQLWTLGYLMYGQPIEPWQLRSSAGSSTVRNRLQWGRFLQTDKEHQLIDLGSEAFVNHPVWRAYVWTNVRGAPTVFRKLEAVVYMFSVHVSASSAEVGQGQWVGPNRPLLESQLERLMDVPGRIVIGQPMRRTGEYPPHDAEVLRHVDWSHQCPNYLFQRSADADKYGEWGLAPTRPECTLSGPLQLLVSHFTPEDAPEASDRESFPGPSHLRTLLPLNAKVRHDMARALAEPMERMFKERGLPLRCTDAKLETLADYRAARPRRQ